MKKKILFIMPSLNSGGAEKSLVTLLNSIDYSMYEVDLQLFKKEGIFLKSIPSEVNLLDEITLINTFMLPLKDSMRKLIFSNRRLFLFRILYSIKYKIFKNKVKQKQNGWRYIYKDIKGIKKEYDAVIGYLEMWPIYFAIDKVNAKTKLGYIHTNYKKYGLDQKFDFKYFEKLNFILTVSKECEHSLMKVFPKLENKINVLENIVSKKTLRNMADTGTGFEDSFNGLKILSIGRLDYNKGHDLAIKACARLIKNGYNIRWYVFGEGSQKQEFKNMVDEYHLTEHFIFLGTTSNPYPYLKQADIYVHPSRLEGKSIAIEEAKILCKPIVVTSFATVAEQIQHEVDGIIVEMDDKSLFNGIAKLIENISFREELSLNLSKKDFSNQNEVLSKFHQILNS